MRVLRVFVSEGVEHSIKMTSLDQLSTILQSKFLAYLYVCCSILHQTFFS